MGTEISINNTLTNIYNMHRTIKIKILISIFFLWGGPGHDVSAQSPAERPNFIVIITDDQGYGDVGYMGNDAIITPNLDQMARTGLRLDRHYSAPVCSPTRASLLTGRYPTRMGVFYWGHSLRPQEQSIANVLKGHGYQTGFFGKWHLGSIRDGQPTSPGAHGFETWYAAANFYENDPWMSHNGLPVQLKGESSDVTVELALDYIMTAKEKEDPFLIFICLGSPHLPHEAAEYLKNLYPDQPENMQNYLGEITGIDLAVGKLRKQLRAWNLSDNTLVWFSSDNGGKFPEGNNHNLKDQKGTLYEGGIRIPALIEWPGKVGPGINTVATGTVDVFPTLLELAGVDDSVVSHPLDGISLVPLIEGKVTERPDPLGFWTYPEIKGQGMKNDQIFEDYKQYLNGELDASQLNEGLLNGPDHNYPGMEQYPYSGSYAWIENQWKLLQVDGMYKLFNVVADPGENNDLSNQHPERVQRMKQKLQTWLGDVVQSIHGKDYK